MTLGNVDLEHVCCPKHLRMGTVKMKYDKQTLLLLLLLLLLILAAQAQVGKTSLLINCFHNHGKLKKRHNSGNQPTVDCTLKPIHRSGVKHSIWKVIPHTNVCRQEILWKLERTI